MVRLYCVLAANGVDFVPLGTFHYERAPPGLDFGGGSTGAAVLLICVLGLAATWRAVSALRSAVTESGWGSDTPPHWSALRHEALSAKGAGSGAAGEVRPLGSIVEEHEPELEHVEKPADPHGTSGN